MLEDKEKQGREREKGTKKDGERENYSMKRKKERAEGGREKQTVREAEMKGAREERDKDG